jgi:dynein heavy chain
MVQTILDIQPRDAGTGVGGLSPDDIVLNLVASLLESHPLPLDPEEQYKDLFKSNELGLKHCLATVLEQEMEKFNRLLKKMESSLV